MLTPRELRQIDFRRVFRGYDPQEVDEFLGRLIEEYERIFKEHQAEPAKVRPPAPAGEEEGPRGGAVPAEVHEAAEMARQAAEELRSNAQWEARLILDEARQRAARVEEEARQQAAQERTRLRELREEVDRLLRQLRRLSDEYLEAAAEYGGNEDERLARPRTVGLPAVERSDAEPDEEGETRSFPMASIAAKQEPEEEDRPFRRYGRG